MKIEQLREQTSQELRTRGRELKHEVLNLRIQKATGQLEDKFRIRALRKENARIETILMERRIGIVVSKGEKKTSTPKKPVAKQPATAPKAPAKKAAKKTAAKAAAKKDSE